jgi:hypothetical protein
VNRRIVEQQLRSGRLAEAIAFLSRHSRADFPPLWDPPPQLGYGEYQPSLIDVLTILTSTDLSPPLRALFADKLKRQFASYGRRDYDWPYRPSFFRVLNLPDARLKRFVELLQAVPEGPEIAMPYRKDVDDLLNAKETHDYGEDGRDPNPLQPLTPGRQELLRSLYCLSDPIAAKKAKVAFLESEEWRHRAEAFRGSLAEPPAEPNPPPSDLAELIATEPPQEGSEPWRAATYSSTQWAVFLRDGHPAARVYEEEDDWKKLPFAIKSRWTAAEGLSVESVDTQGDKTPSPGKTNVYAAKVEDGWIVGFNAGEFGASLWWFAPDGKKWYRISNDQVCGFLQTPQGVIALEGLAHLGIDRGKIIRLSRGPNGKWKSELFGDLGQSPRAATFDQRGALVVVTSKRLLRVRLDKHIDVLLDKAFWSGLYPNSIILDAAGTIYIGMRQGVAKIAQTGAKRTVTWFLPNPDARIKN